jgi:hypothetical protein
MIDDLPDVPDPAIDPPKAFSSKAAALVLALKTMVVQIRAAIASIGIIAGGSANKIPYRIDLNTTMADPVTGWMRLNSATQNAATAMAIDIVGNDSVDYTSLISTFTGPTSAVLGQIRIEKQADASKFLVFALTAMTTPAGYRQLTVACIGYSSANPFAQGDPVVFSYSRTGDKGDPGATGFAKFSDRKAAGTGGGTSLQAPGAYNVRTLNTTDANTFGATLASNAFTLPAGKYVIEARAPAYAANQHRAAIRNQSDNSYLAYGSSAYASAGPSYPMQSDSVVTAYVEITASKSFQIWHAMSIGTTDGLGVAANQFAASEVYTEVSIWKLA